MSESRPDAAPGPEALLRSNDYLRVLLLAALLGVPISALAIGFLKLVHELQHVLFELLPHELGFDHIPAWWPMPILFLSGVLTAAAITRFKGNGGEPPSVGAHAGGVTPPAEVPGIVLAGLASLGFGAVLGPEAPLIAVGSGLGALAVRLASRDAPQATQAVIAAAGSFAAISALFGSPLLAAFLMLEIVGLAGPQAALVLMPGLLSAGVGTLIFVGLISLTGLGVVSLSLPDLPPFGQPTLAMFGWAIAFGVGAALLGKLLHSLALVVRPHVARRTMLLMPVVGLAIGASAMAFELVTDKSHDQVLFSGQEALGPLIVDAGTWSVGALLAVVVFKGIAYSLSLSAFRGGAIFPAMFIGAAVGVAASDLPGLELIPAVAMGIGGMTAAMLRLPLTSVLLATLLLASNGLQVMPLVIVTVVVAHVAAARIDAPPADPAPAAA